MATAEHSKFCACHFRLLEQLALCLSLGVLPGLVMLDRFSRGSRHRRRVIHAFALACLLSLAITWSACGGGGNSGSGTHHATYNLTVSGTFTSGSASLRHTVPLILIVQ